MILEPINPAFLFRLLLTSGEKNMFSEENIEALTVCPPAAGVSGPDGHGRPHPLRAQPAAHHRPHPGRVRVPGAGVQRPDVHLHLPADAGAVEPGGGASGGLLHRHRPRLHLPLGGRLLRQRGHRHLRPAVHLLPMGACQLAAPLLLYAVGSFCS